MTDISNTTKQNKRKKLKKILWILFPVFFIIAFVSLNMEIGPLFIGLAFFILVFVDIIIIYLLSEKYYNWPITSVIIFLIGMLFKRQHWPLAGDLLTIGIMILCITSLINAVRFHFSLRKNPFLRWFGSISCLIVAIYMFGWLLMMQHWSAKLGNTLGYIGIALFVLSVLGMVFTLPGSNYLNWDIIERKIFYRSVIVPMVIVFSLIILSLVFSEAFLWIMNRSGRPLGLKESIELFNLEGLGK